MLLPHQRVMARWPRRWLVIEEWSEGLEQAAIAWPQAVMVQDRSSAKAKVSATRGTNCT